MAVIQNHVLPANSTPVGYARLVRDLNLQAPLRRASVISDKSVKGNKRIENDLAVYDKREGVALGDNPLEHIEFAIRREPIDLLILKKSFQVIGADAVTAYVVGQNSSIPCRKMWFLYEWLTGRQLSLPASEATHYVEILDPTEYHALSRGENSPRHKIRNNLPGTPQFCAIARRDEGVADDLRARVAAFVGGVRQDVLRRASAYMELSDSKSSFEIEKESPPVNRLQRWGRTLGRAGTEPLSPELFLRLQDEILSDDRFVHRGFRNAGVFLGYHTRDGQPVPEFIGASPIDVPSLVEGITAFDGKARLDEGFDPVVFAASLSFGFVVAHPLEDGNGRLSRYLIAYALAAKKMAPNGVFLPVSQQIQERLSDYIMALQDISAPMMPFIPWKATANGNVEVTGDTGDLYRFPDVTSQTAFLRECVAATVDSTLPKEVKWIEGHDKATAAISAIVDMPAPKVSQLVNFVAQQDGRLSNKRRKKDFDSLTDGEVERIEAAVRAAFDLPDPPTEEDASAPSP